MQFLMTEEKRVFWVHSSDWRTNSRAVNDINLQLEFDRPSGSLPSRMPGCAMPGEVLPEVRIKLSGDLPETGSLLLHLPFAFVKEDPSQIEVDGGEWQYMFPLLEVFLPVNEIKLHNFPVPEQPETLLLESFIRCSDNEVLNLPETPLYISDMPAERIEVRLSSNFSGGIIRYSALAEQPEAQRFMADRLCNDPVEFQINGEKVETVMRNGVAVGTLPLRNRGAFQAKSFYLGREFLSNIADPSFAADLPYNIFWGDMHVHSHESDGVGEPEAIVERARDWQKLDFMAFQEHIEHATTWRVWTPEKWQKLKALYDRSTVDNEFVIIPGYELRGFCNLWCFSDDYINSLTPYLNCDEAHKSHGLIDPEWDDEQVILRAFIARLAADKDYLVGYHRLELLLDQQRCLPPPVQFLQMAHYKRPPEVGSADYLLRGDRVGFFGSTDTHLGMPATGFKGPREAASGLTAVFAENLSRKKLHEALRCRRTYATLGSRTLLDVRLNGAFMGEELTVQDGCPIEINIRACGRERLSGFEIVSRGRDIYHADLDGKTFFEHTFRTRKYGMDHDYYFVRLHLEDNRKVWSSPIYLN